MREIVVETADYHTGGEPFRIVVGGAPHLAGATILEKRAFAARHADDIRRLLVFEPRGHADMYGCFVTDPEDDDGDLGVVFFHNAGYSTACGHGTIALVTWALETGRIAATGPTADVAVDAPSGRLHTRAVIDEGRVSSVTFRNVPSFVVARGLRIDVGGRVVTADVAYGGAFYASVRAADLGLSIRKEDLPRLIDDGRTIKAELEAAGEFVHPDHPEIRDVYGVIFYDDEGRDATGLKQKNVTIFADGEVDRSPCGSGTSARLALLDATGELARDEELLHSSIVGSRFRGRVVGDVAVGGHAAVETEVEGNAHPTGIHRFVLRREDELGTGFLLR